MELMMFSTLNYHSSLENEPSIVVGILFSEYGKISFSSIKDFKILADFDSELDLEFMRLFLQSIENECKEISNIENYIKQYVNELKFSGLQFTQETKEKIIKRLLTNNQ